MATFNIILVPEPGEAPELLPMLPLTQPPDILLGPVICHIPCRSTKDGLGRLELRRISVRKYILVALTEDNKFLGWNPFRGFTPEEKSAIFKKFCE